MAEKVWTSELRELASLKPRRSLAMEAAETLREFILVGKLSAGMPVRERDLAEAFGISRTPLKEALRILEADGLIEYGPTRRPSVADPSLAQIQDWLRVQGALEALAGELACEVATDREFAKIEALNETTMDLRNSGKPIDGFRCDMEFHSAIVAAAGNPALLETHTTYNARLWRVRYLSSERKVGVAKTMREHLDIIAALKARDGAAAAAALKRHLKSAEANITAVLTDVDASKEENT